MSRSGRGFSLVELLVSTSLVGLAVVMAVEALSAGLRPLGGAPTASWAAALAAVDEVRRDVAASEEVLAPRRAAGPCRGPVLVLRAWDGSVVAWHDEPGGAVRTEIRAGAATRRAVPGSSGVALLFQYRGDGERVVRLRVGVGDRILFTSAVLASAGAPPPPAARGTSLDAWLSPFLREEGVNP